MSQNVVRYPNVSGNDRRQSADVWREALTAYAEQGPEYGSYYFDDFLEPYTNTSDATAVNGWFIQDAAAGGTSESFASIDGVDGIRSLSAASGTDWFGIEAHRGESATNVGLVTLPTHATDPRGDAIYEVRLYDLDSAEADTFFIGFTEPIVEFLSATGTLPTNSDYIGFYRVDAGGLQFVCANDNNGGTAVAYAVTILAAADIPNNANCKFGFRVNDDQSVEIFVNGEKIAVDTSGAVISVNPLALPIEYLTPKFSVLRGATGDNATVNLDLDWLGYFVKS